MQKKSNKDNFMLRIIVQTPRLVRASYHLNRPSNIEIMDLCLFFSFVLKLKLDLKKEQITLIELSKLYLF